MKGDDAVSEILSLVLIAGVVIAVFVAAAVVSVPAYEAEKEVQHQILLEDEFSSLKTGIDFLWLTGTYDTEKTVLVSLSADTAVSGKLAVGSAPLEITADEGVFTLPLAEVTYANGGVMQYMYRGGALYKGDTLLTPASESPTHTVLICRKNAMPHLLYATEPVPVLFSLEEKAEYHQVSYGEKQTDLLTVYYVRLDGGMR